MLRTMGASLPLRQRLPSLEPRQQVGLALALVSFSFIGWALFWRVPTEVTGRGVLLVPNDAGLLNARAEGQVKRVLVTPGDRVQKGQLLLELYLPVLEKQLERQRQNLVELQLHNRRLDARDQLRLSTEKLSVETALLKLRSDRQRYGDLKQVYANKLTNLQWLSKRDVVAPLSQEVVQVEKGFVDTDVNLDEIHIREKDVLTAYQKVKLQIETEALERRMQIDDLRRSVEVTEAKLAYDAKVLADRDGQVLDLQVIRGQTVKLGNRLGTIGSSLNSIPLRAVAYFKPADARRLPKQLKVEVVPDWKERSRFGGIVAEVGAVNVLPATEEDISTTTGNPQFAKDLVKEGPVMRTELQLLRDPHSPDGFRWTLSSGSRVFPIRDGLTMTTHAYVEWRTPLSYVLPGLRSITGGYRSGKVDRSFGPNLLQGGATSW
jgi:HlyD family secretion protein